MFHVCTNKGHWLSRVMRRYLAVALVLALSVPFLYNPGIVKAQGTTYTWTGGAGTSDWHTAGNWNPAQVPTDGDIVKMPEFSVVECANADVTVSLDCAGTLTVSGGTLNLAGNSYLKEKGTLDGAGSIAVTGAESQLIWQGGDILGTGSFSVGTGAKLEIGYATTKNLERPLACDGAINLNAGTLRLSGGGQVDGNIILGQNTTLNFAGGNYAICGSLSDTGSGAEMAVGAGNVVFVGAYNIKNTTVKGGATAFWNGTTEAIVSNLFVQGHAIFDKDISIFGLSLQSGHIGGNGDITLVNGGNKLWQGGVIEGDAGLIIAADSENLNISGNCSLFRSLMNNSHIIIGSGGSLELGGAKGTGGFNIQDGGSLRLGGPGSYSLGSATSQVTNNGQLIISDYCSKVELNTDLNQQSASGILAFDIGEAGRFCKLEINNQALINSSQLKINLVDGFVPADGATFEVMTYTSCLGRFAGITSNEESITFTPRYNPTNLTLTAVSAVEQVEVPTANPVATFGYVIQGTADTDPPVWAGDFPKAIDASTSGFTLQAKIDEAGTAYYVILDDEAAAPTAAQVKAGQSSTGEAVADGHKGSISLTADTVGSDVISGLDPETPYDIYVVAEDTAGNLQATPAKLDITTLRVLSSDAEITAFSFVEQTGAATINSVARTVNIEVQNGTDSTSLVATFSLSAGANATVGDVSQVSGTTANTFTNPVVYTVTAEDGTTIKNWTVTVTVKDPPPAADEPFWRYRSPLPTCRDLTEVKYLNGKFMALGEAGTLVVSTDGVNWESVCVDAIVTLRGITYSNGLYVAVGFCNERDGRVYTSPDGINWTQAVETKGHNLYDVTYGNNKFVAVGQGQKVVVSRDGITWEVKAAPLLKNMYSIIYTGSHFYAVGGGSSNLDRIMQSLDGEDWVNMGEAACALRDVAYGNEILVTVGTTLSTQPYIYTAKADGTFVTPFPPEASGYNYTRLNTVEYDGSKFIAAGYSYSPYKPYVITSADGINWTKESVSVDVQFRALTVGNGTLVGVGDSGDIASSTAGETWIKRTLCSNRMLDDVAYNGSIFVAVGLNGAIQTSTDGITWTARVSGTTERLNSVEYLNNKFIAVGSGGVILTSEDGITWTKRTVTGISISTLPDVTYGNNLYIIVGRGTSHNAIILTSSDGDTWSLADHNHNTVSSTITYGNGTFIALGYNQVYRSNNGSDWTGTYFSGMSPLDITYADGRFIATGENGVVYISGDNGVSWTVIEKVAGVQDNINSAAYGGGNLVAVANSGKILISFDKGNTWEQQVSGYSLDLNGVVAGSSNFVAVGGTGLTLQSKDFGTPSEPDDPDADAVAAAKAALTWESIKGGNILQDNVTVNLVNPLPTAGASDTTISWSASPTGWINITTGEVTRPTSAQGDKTVTLTATISKGSASDTKTFTLTIKATAPEQTADEAIALDLTALTWNTIKGANSSESNVTSKLVLPTGGANGTIISWSVDTTGLVNTGTGAVSRPSSSQGNKTVTLTATVSKAGGTSRTKDFVLTIIALSDSGSGGGSGGGSGVTTYTISVTAGTGGTVTPKTIKVKVNASQTFTITPDLGYEIEDVLVDGKSIGAKTSYTFKKVTGKHTISATFKKVEDVPVIELPFKDVYENNWFYNSVKYAYEKGLMQGTGPDTFGPFLDTSRAMIVTILHRLEKTPAGLENTFTDVAAGTWYTDAVAWAAANGIVAGYGGNLFGPSDSITREQLACILYRYARYAGYYVSQSGSLTVFTDGGEISEWAVEAIKWAVGSGLIQGKDGNILDPAGPATRAEVATILQRFIENNTK